MSMPRRAMKDMGFQACCLWCDEPDEAGSSRCGKCIASHSRIRDEMAKAPPEDAFFQFAKELLAMSVAPHRHDNDPIHGAVLEEQQRRAGQYIPKGKEQTEQDVLEIFEQQKKIEKGNIIKILQTKTNGKIALLNLNSPERLVQKPGITRILIRNNITQAEPFLAKKSPQSTVLIVLVKIWKWSHVPTLRLKMRTLMKKS